MTASVAIERQGAVGLITLNRPERHNAFDDAVIAELTEALRSIEAEDGIRVVVLSGAAVVVVVSPQPTRATMPNTASAATRLNTMILLMVPPTIPLRFSSAAFEHPARPAVRPENLDVLGSAPPPLDFFIRVLV